MTLVGVMPVTRVMRHCKHPILTRWQAMDDSLPVACQHGCRANGGGNPADNPPCSTRHRARPASRDNNPSCHNHPPCHNNAPCHDDPPCNDRTTPHHDQCPAQPPAPGPAIRCSAHAELQQEQCQSLLTFFRGFSRGRRARTALRVSTRPAASTSLDFRRQKSKNSPARAKFAAP